MSYNPFSDNPMHPHQLKIKAKTLAAEAQIIRHTENKFKKSARYNASKQRTDMAVRDWFRYNDLRNHRTIQVRDTARATHLARAMLKGQAYSKVEQGTKVGEVYPAVIRDVARMIRKYGHVQFDVTHQEAIQMVKEWIQATSVDVAKAAE